MEGTFTRNGEKEIYAAQRVRDSVVLVVRPDVVTSGDFARYLTALLISAGLAALLAAGAAALLSRRLTAPLGRVAEASRVLAAGGSPEPVPREQTTELAALADAFNDMAAQLETAREAERAVLLSVSHELRTPLTSIKGYAEGIEDSTVAPREAAPVIGREAGRLERLVADLLALARLRQGVLEIRSESVDLGAAAREAVERLRMQARSADVDVSVEGSAADRDRRPRPGRPGALEPDRERDPPDAGRREGDRLARRRLRHGARPRPGDPRRGPRAPSTASTFAAATAPDRPTAPAPDWQSSAS